MFLIESRKPDTIGPIATLSCRVTNVGKIAVPPQLRYIWSRGETWSTSWCSRGRDLLIEYDITNDDIYDVSGT